jgi:intracellular sulfur oxidation DsrE/DsrF family protein
MKDQFNSKTKKRLANHEVYEMVNDVHVVLCKQKLTGKNIEEDDIWKKQKAFGSYRIGKT